MRKHVNKVFELEARLAALTDCRRDPTVPQAPMLQTWFWALAKRLPSTEQLGDMLADPRWRRRVGLTDEDGGSPDTAVRVLDQWVVDEINELALDLVLGDALYCCRPFFALAKEHGIDALAVSSGVTEMDEEIEEIELLMRTEPATVELLPVGQGWKVGRSRWEIEDGTFNALTRSYNLEHNYHHNVVAMLMLLVLRSLALCMTLAYHREDWVRYSDAATSNDAASPAVRESG